MGDQVRDLGALGLVFIALLVVAYATIIGGSEQGLGALISVLSAGVGYYLRGRVESQAPPGPQGEQGRRGPPGQEGQEGPPGP